MRKTGFSGEMLWQWNEVPILWGWVFCLISGGGKLGWASNMPLFGYGSLGRGWMPTRGERGCFCVRAHFKVLIRLYHGGAAASLRAFSHSPPFKSCLLAHGGSTRHRWRGSSPSEDTSEELAFLGRGNPCGILVPPCGIADISSFYLTLKKKKVQVFTTVFRKQK